MLSYKKWSVSPLTFSKDVHHRVKRSESESSESREEIDWDEVLGNATFNRWDQLQGSNNSYKYYKERDDEYEAAMAYAYVTADVGAEYAEKGGNLKKNFIASCKFNGYQCSPMWVIYLCQSFKRLLQKVLYVRNLLDRVLPF